MLDLLTVFLENRALIAGEHYFLGQLELFTLQGLSDLLIALTYYAISLALFYLVRKRPDLPFSGLLLLLGVVMLSCGTTHLSEAWAFQHPGSWLVGASKLTTAAIALTTVVLIGQRIPKMLALPDIAQLESANQSMQQAITAQAQIEAELILSRDLRESIFNESADALFLVDSQTLLTLDCNRRAVELFQAADKARLIGIKGHTLQRHQFSQDDLDEILAEMQSKGMWSRELEYITCQGNCFWGNIAATPITVAGRLMNLVRVTDITERKRATEQRRSLNERLQYLLSYAPVVIFSCKTEGDYGATWISENVHTLFGYEPQEFLEDSGFWINHIHPEDRDHVLEHVPQLFKAGHYVHEYRFLHRDGEYRYVYDQLHLIRDETGAPSEIVGYIIDITARRQTEIALKASEQQLSTLISNLPGYVYRVLNDSNFTPIYVSPGVTAITGYQQGEYLSDRTISCSQVLHPDDAGTLWEIVQTAVRDRQAYEFEYRIITKTGQQKWVWGRGRGIYAENGALQWLEGFVTDISERKRNEAERKQAEAALQVSESRFQSLVTNMPGMVYRYSPSEGTAGTFTYVSPGGYELLELDPAHVLHDANSIWNLIHPEDLPSLQTSVAIAVENCENWHWEGRLITPSGQLKWIQGNSRPQTTPEGTVWDGLMTDITDRKLAVIALQESEERFQEIANTIPQMFFVRSLNPDRYAYISPAFEKIWGRSRAELMQNPWIWMEAVHPDDRNLVLTSVETQFRGNSVQREYRIVRPDGTIRWILADVTVIRNEAGNPIRFIGLADDISERKIGEIALAQEILRRRTLFDTSIDGIIVLDQAGNVIEANTSFARMLGYTLEEISTLNLIDFDMHETQEELENKIDEFNLCRHWFETRYRRKDGSIYHVEISTNPVDWDGQFVQFCICRDVSERKQTEAALRQSEATNRAMLAAIPDLLLRVKRDGTCLNFIPPDSPDAGTFLPLKHHIAEILPPDLLQHQLRRIKQALETGELQIWEHQFLKNGKPCDEEVRVSPCGADEVLVIVRDISKRKQAEEALQRYERIVSATTDAILLIDRSYICQIVNKAYLSWHNKQQDEIVGHLISDILPNRVFQNIIKPHLDQCFAGQFVQFEMRVDYLTVEPQYVSVTLAPYFDMSQTLSGAVASIRDITGLRQAEVELELQSIILKNMAEGVCMIKASDSTLLYTNPKLEQMFGYDADELKGKHTSILNYEDENTDPRAVHQEITTAVLQHGVAAYSVHNVKKDGTPFWCRGISSIFQHPDYGTVMVAVQQDVTEKKWAEEQLTASLKEKDVLLKEIHHRVKNNLGVVDGLLKMQARRSHNPEVVAALRESQNRIASIALVHEKLYGSEDFADIDFAQYINDLTAHLFDCYNIYANQVKLTVKIDDVSLDIDTAIPCGLIINELVSNALKYAFSNTQAGEIQVTFCQRPGQILLLTVQDNGIGLPSDFDIENAKTLGISLVQGLVKQLQGTLEVRTQPGTMFLISFRKN